MLKLVLFLWMIGITRAIFTNQLPKILQVNTEEADKYTNCVNNFLKEISQGINYVNFYSNNSSVIFNYIDKIMKDSFASDKQINLLNLNKINQTCLNSAYLCAVMVDTEEELIFALKELYNVRFIGKSAILITYREKNMTEHITNITRQISITGMQRNIIFAAYSGKKYYDPISIYSLSPYSAGYCKSGNFVVTGYCAVNKLIKKVPNLFPPANNLGNCPINITIDPPFRPYIKEISDNPKGFIGAAMNEMSKIMNFKPIYHWPANKNDYWNHADKDYFNVICDMGPTVTPSQKKNFVSLGMVMYFYVAEYEESYPIYRNLSDPFDTSTWILTFATILAILLLAFLSSIPDTSNLLLKIIGIFVGVGVGKLVVGSCWIIFWWSFLLPSFVLQQSYLAALTDNLTIPQITVRAENLIDLHQNYNYTVYCPTGLKKVLCSYFKPDELWFQVGKICVEKNLTYLNDVVVPNALQSGKLNKTSICLNQEIIDAYKLDSFYLFHNHYSMQNIYGFRSALFFEELKKIWRTFDESGISLHLKRLEVTEFPDRGGKPEFQDKLMGSQKILLYGYLTSIAAFIMEIVIKYWNKIRDAIKKIFLNLLSIIYNAYSFLKSKVINMLTQ